MNDSKRSHPTADAEDVVFVVGDDRSRSPDGDDRSRSPVGDPEDLVDYTAPLLPGGVDGSVFCAVNGETIRIQRGKSVKIKRKFVEVLENAAKQELEAYRYMRAAQKSSGPIASM